MGERLKAFARTRHLRIDRPVKNQMPFVKCVFRPDKRNRTASRTVGEVVKQLAELVAMGTTLAEFGRGALFVLIGDPFRLGYLKSAKILASMPDRLTPPRDDRHSKAGSRGGKDCAHN